MMIVLWLRPTLAKVCYVSNNKVQPYFTLFFVSLCKIGLTYSSTNHVVHLSYTYLINTIRYSSQGSFFLSYQNGVLKITQRTIGRNFILSHPTLLLLNTQQRILTANQQINLYIERRRIKIQPTCLAGQQRPNMKISEVR